MKKIVLTLLIAISSLFAEVSYTHIFDAYEEAKAQKKLVLIMLSQKGCPGCQHMENIVFEDKDVNAYMKEEYIVVHVDVYEEGPPDGLDFFATPTFYILDEDEKILKRLNGGENATAFLKTLKSVNNQKK
jgi:thioredoxin-related protein